MKKILSIVLASLVATLFCVLALAEDKKENIIDKEILKGSAMMGGEGIMEQKKMMGMRGMMMKSMMDKSLVASSDGGVVVMIGNRLLKYDKDLNLQKEVEIKIDREGMQKMMMQMKEKCPMHKKMTEEGGLTGEGVEETKKQEVPPASSSQ